MRKSTSPWSAAPTAKAWSSHRCRALRGQPWRRAEIDEGIRDGNRSVRLLEVLEHCDHRARRHGGAVQRVHVLPLAVSPEPDVEAPRLEVGRVRRRRDLAVTPLAGEPRFDVVLLRRRCTEIARGDIEDAVGDAKLLHELLFDGKQPLMLIPRLLRLAEDEHLDLVELVHAEHPARVPARSAGFAPK